MVRKKIENAEFDPSVFDKAGGERREKKITG